MAKKLGGFVARTFNVRHSLYERGLTYDRQGAIYFACKNYFTLFNEEEKQRFNRLLLECCKYNQDACDAVFMYLTCDLSSREICKEYKITKTTLYRYLDDFYLNFEYVKKVF